MNMKVRFTLLFTISFVVVTSALFFTTVWRSSAATDGAEFMNMFVSSLPIFLVFIILSVGLSVFFGFFVLPRTLMTKFQKVSSVMEALSSGDFSKSATIEDDEELENLYQYVNDLSETLESYVVSATDKSALEDKLITILDVVSTAAEGDFTKRAPVTPDMIGTIADAFNLMSDSLVSLLSEVKDIAMDVSQQSLTIASNLNEILNEINTQMIEVDKGATTVGSALVTFQNIAKKSIGASKSTDIASKSSIKGKKTMSEGAQSMQIVRNTSATISRKMKSLNERILEIGKIMEIITEVASRTHLLALNASIEASRAGEQGKGFLIIADEIRKLSDKSTASAKDIENIIKSIQFEATEMTLAIERSTQQVEVEAQLTSVAEASFKKVEESVNVANTAMMDISNATKAQAIQTNNLHNAMNKVSKIAHRTGDITRDIAALVENLNKNSNNLLAAIGRFKIYEVGAAEHQKFEETLDGTYDEQELIENHEITEIEETDVFDGFPLDNLSSEDNILAAETLDVDEKTQPLDMRVKQITQGNRYSSKPKKTSKPKPSVKQELEPDDSLLSFNELEFPDIILSSKSEGDTDVMFEQINAPNNKKNS